MHPTVLIQRYLDAGTLVELRPDTDMVVDLYWAHARNAQAGLERLTQCVIAAARNWLDPLPAAGE
jgi:LysR family transcriptional regulator (chromosome initiation inhibitor)